MHEDNDIMGVFALEEYTHVPPGKGFFQLGCFVAAVLGLCGAVYMVYPDTPAYPREFENGLEEELGGPKATRVSLLSELSWILLTQLPGESCGRSISLTIKDRALYIIKIKESLTVSLSESGEIP